MKRTLELAISAGASVVLAEMVFGNFTRPVREKIWVRARGLSELSKRSDRPRECAHLDHNKSRLTYNSPDTGLLVTDVEHLAHHLIFRDYPQDIGLTRAANSSAIKSLVYRCRQYNAKIGLSEEDFDQELSEAADLWEAKVYAKEG